MKIDISKCTGCGACASVCPEQAITVRDNLATINSSLCIDCGKCAEVCPSGAILGATPARREPAKGGERMFYGYGGGFGFRGSSSAWPYIGRGRGGLPRCWSPGLYGGVAAYPIPRTAPYTPAREDELSFLKNQADAMKRDMAEIERRIQELERKG